jgi:predicted helicase
VVRVKTFTALKIAEDQAGAGKRVLFLVPSLALLSQTLTEWTNEKSILLKPYAVCSDVSTGKHNKNDDLADISISDLAYPATTDAKKLAHHINTYHHPDEMTVVFSTYQSLAVISKAQKEHGLAEFDLIICDEAHRTTGATLAGEDESSFVKIHDEDYIKGAYRLYMTATPRVFGDAVKSKAKEVDAVLCSMDDTSKFGDTLYTINFSEAVSRGLLCDYKVLVLAVDEAHIAASIQKILSDEDNELKLDDASKIVGCWKALSKIGVNDDIADDTHPMTKAVAFCKDIKSSKAVTQYFPQVVAEYVEHEELQEALRCEVDHVDGNMNATVRKKHLDWLKMDTSHEEGDVCHILSNARCLSEGVDVPSLDAILFMHPRKSQIDVVQSVGRVMRTAPGKKRGYVILPIGIPAGMTPEEALNDNEKYKVVWQILQALRSHDDGFDAAINKIDLGADVSGKIEVIAVTNSLPNASSSTKTDNPNIGGGKGGSGKGDGEDHENPDGNGKSTSTTTQGSLDFPITEIEKAIYAKIVKKVGNRLHWEEWAGDIAKIAQTHITRITAILENPNNTAEITAFNGFLTEIRDDLNDSISEGEAIEMLAQHIITKPVFDALFEGYSFAEHNPVSKAMESVLNVLNEHNLQKEADTLDKFYASVRTRAAGINNAAGKQKIVVELYDKFFRNAFPKMTERLGIVYTPVEVVDFIIHSVNDLLQSEFNQTLGSDNVHILDPFTGTGTFITRLMQSGLISKEDLPNKYANQIHANEIVLLAYYIAAINVESVYHDITGNDYTAFNGICLTDTFQLHEKDDLISGLLVDNSARRVKQKKLDIRVIIGNPPYSIGQSSANDNNGNIEYPTLDGRIEATYAKESKANLQKGLYDSYIRAIRWASDRIGESGVIGFVTNAGFVEANTADGLRKCLKDEFSSVYIFHLRGNARTSGEQRRKEKDNVFGQGTRTPIAVSLLVKNPQATSHGNIFFHDIGDYLSQQEKLAKIAQFKSMAGISTANGWQPITPDEHNDWLNQRDNSFSEHISMGDKKDKTALVLFENYSNGVNTSRDAWVYNFSKKSLNSNIQRMINFYNLEVDRWKASIGGLNKEQQNIENFISTDAKKISWSRSLKNNLSKMIKHTYDESRIRTSLYRPFTKQHLYFDKYLNEMVLQIPRIFPQNGLSNKVIIVTGLGASKGFTALMAKETPNFDSVEKSQCFPLYLYEPTEQSQPADNPNADMFAPKPQTTTNGYTRKDAITDAGLKHFTDAYPTESISKEDLFYYIYGLLHSPDYRTKYADNLSKELPRIPKVATAQDFWAFSTAGRKLADLHINYETQPMYAVEFVGGALLLDSLDAKDFYVEKMKFGKSSSKAAGKDDKTTIIYNSKITVTGIPLEAYEYVVNGKPAIEWVMERYGVSTHKDSGIVNDANAWGLETANNPRYPLELLLRVIKVSLETMKVVNGLPRIG